MHASVIDWLEKEYRNNPDFVAIVDEKEKVTYERYREKAVAVAAEIIGRGYASKKPVIVYMPKSVAAIQSFLGIAYAGCFYSPIDVEMPQSRVTRILETLQAGLVITTEEYRSQILEFGFEGEIIIYDEANLDKYASLEKRKEIIQEVLARASKTIDTDVLYVFFTSGSTGTPKGVSVTHRGVIDYVEWYVEHFKMTSMDRVGNQTPLYFDLSTGDIYCSLLAGACVYLIPKNLFPQPVRLLQYMKDNRISIILWVPSALMLISKLKAFKSVDISDTLKTVTFCGEVMPNKQLNIWRKFLPNIKYSNLYGPTETVVASTYYDVEREFADDESLPIGFPMPNTETLILDDKDNLVTEPGKSGELCIRGTSLMMGYYKNPEKTKEALVQNPLQDAFEEKIYRTGDIVEYNEYGEIMYLSRKDFQIKHLGHRIELGEIETAISSVEGITSSCCLYDEKHSRIVAFLDINLSKEELNDKLKEMLPEYMLPGKVVFMEEVPHNANGKIDRVKLKEQM